MERVRIAVIGLGWFGEIHCQAIAGIPGLELTALAQKSSQLVSYFLGGGHGMLS